MQNLSRKEKSQTCQLINEQKEEINYNNKTRNKPKTKNNPEEGREERETKAKRT